MGVSPWEDVSHTFMIQIRPWTLSLRSNLYGFSVRPILDWHWLPYLAHGFITIRRCVAYNHDQDTTLNYWPEGQNRVLTCFRVRPITFLKNWHWLNILGTWVCHHKTMCCVHSWSRFEVDLLPQGKIYRPLLSLHVRPLPFVDFDISIPYLAHGSFTMRECVKYIHDPDTTLNFDLKVKFYYVL